MASNRQARSVRYRRRHFATLAAGAVLLAIVGGMFSTSASKNGKSRVLNASSALATTSFSRSSTGQANGSLWEAIDEASIVPAGNRVLVPAKYRTVRLNKDALAALLATAPMEFTRAAQENPPIITLPMPDGNLARFQFRRVSDRGARPGGKVSRAQDVSRPGHRRPDRDLALRLVADRISRDRPVACRHGADRSLREWRSNQLHHVLEERRGEHGRIV